MAKKSKIAKAQKREALVAKYADKRAALKLRVTILDWQLCQRIHLQYAFITAIGLMAVHTLTCVNLECHV